MRKRDLGILLLSAFAIFFSLRNEGGFSFREAWVHVLDESYPIRHESERLPPPIVADLNGDGRKEVLIATHDAKIQVLGPGLPTSDGDFGETRLLAELSLMPDRVRISAGRRPVAMAVGYVRKAQTSYASKEQVLVVVTAGWTILCFDHNLKKLWEASVQDEFPRAAHHKEVAISISNYTLRHGDTGLIIVGGSMEVQPQLHLDPIEEEIVQAHEEERHRRSASGSENAKDFEDLNQGKSWDKIRHFSYYAYAGTTGQLRWSHNSEDFHRMPDQANDLIPQHNYKLDAAALTRHQGEVECKEFRESVLGVMPHRWERREDTSFELSHFKKHKRKVTKSQPGKTPPGLKEAPEEKHVPGKDTTNKVVDVLGKATKAATSRRPRERIPYIPVITNHTSHWWMPNVVVAHLKEGIEAVHLASGRTVCKLWLTAGGLHADINGDGVLDHVQAVGGAQRRVPQGMLEPLKPCWAIATSGVPVRETLFNGSICRHSPFSQFQAGEFGSRAFGRAAHLAPLEVATPILLPRRDGHRHRKGSHGDVIFLTSRGEVTSFSLQSGHGQEAHRMWQISTGCSWSNMPTPTGSIVEKIVPTLEPLALRKGGPLDAILVAGELEASIIHPDGSRLSLISLPSAPAAPMLIDDFSGDGMNDLILVTENAIYGYVQTRHPGAILFSTLVGVLIVVMAVIFVTQHLSAPKVKPRPGER